MTMCALSDSPALFNWHPILRWFYSLDCVSKIQLAMVFTMNVKTVAVHGRTNKSGAMGRHSKIKYVDIHDRGINWGMTNAMVGSLCKRPVQTRAGYHRKACAYTDIACSEYKCKSAGIQVSFMYIYTLHLRYSSRPFYPYLVVSSTELLFFLTPFMFLWGMIPYVGQN